LITVSAVCCFRVIGSVRSTKLHAWIMYLKSQRPKSAVYDSVRKVLGNVRTGQSPTTMSVRSLVPVSVKIFQQNSRSEFHELLVGFCQHWPASVHRHLS
jgi:hypothetical protein